MKKTRVIAMVAGIVMAVGIASLASILTLNYSGFCIAEFRFVPDEEKINNVVSGLAQGGVTRNFVEKDGKLVEASIVTTLPYKNLDAFYAENPNCCQVGPVAPEGYYEPTLLRRLLGSVSDVVAVRYLRRTVDPTGTVSSEPVLVQFSINNCGRVISTVAF